MSDIQIRELRKSFLGRNVLDGFSLAVESGQRVALVGPNGSGKTTVLRCVAGTVIPDGGSIEIDGRVAGSSSVRDHVTVSFAQERAFYLRLCGRENLLIFSRLRHRTEREAVKQVDALEEELSLREIGRQRADRCSSGMLQQLSIARALLGLPRLILLDEPTRSLDTSAAKRLWDALDNRPGLTVLTATHAPEDIARCDQQVDLRKS